MSTPPGEAPPEPTRRIPPQHRRRATAARPPKWVDDQLLIIALRYKHGGMQAVESTNPYALEIFIRKRADAIIDDVSLLPRLIEREEGFLKQF